MHCFLLDEEINKGLNEDIIEELKKGISSNISYNLKYENIFITNGSSHGLGLISNHLAKKGDYILVEEITYFLTFNIFKDYGLNIIPIKMNIKEGLDIQDLEIKLKK